MTEYLKKKSLYFVHFSNFLTFQIKCVRLLGEFFRSLFILSFLSFCHTETNPLTLIYELYNTLIILQLSSL